MIYQIPVSFQQATLPSLSIYSILKNVFIKKPKMSKTEIWEKLSETPFKAGFRKMINKVFKLPNGKIADFDIKHEGQVAAVLAITTENKVLIARQFRPGPEIIIDELPGGVLDKGENPIEAMKRELLEETGYSGDLEYLGTSLACAYSTRIVHHFLARNCKKIQELNLDDTEFVEVVEKSMEDFKKQVDEGMFSDNVTAYRGLEKLGFFNWQDK